MDYIRLPLKAKAESGNNEIYENVPVVPPHLITCWLLEAGLLSFDTGAATRFFRHQLEVAAMPWIVGDPDFSNLHSKEASTMFQPVSLYGDEAEYTNTKEKVLIIFISYLPAPSYFFVQCARLVSPPNMFACDLPRFIRS